MVSWDRSSGYNSTLQYGAQQCLHLVTRQATAHDRLIIIFTLVIRAGKGNTSSESNALRLSILVTLAAQTCCMAVSPQAV